MSVTFSIADIRSFPGMEVHVRCYEDMVKGLSALPPSSEVEALKEQALKSLQLSFLEKKKDLPNNTTGGSSDYMEYIHRMERRNIYPGIETLERFQASEKMFEQSMESPDFVEHLMKEFYVKAGGGHLDPAFVVVVGSTMAIKGRVATQAELYKNMVWLINCWLLEAPVTQLQCYNFRKASEWPAERQYTSALAISRLPVPLLPFHDNTASRNTDALNAVLELNGGSSVSARLQKGFTYPNATVWGSGYLAPVYDEQGAQTGVADLSEVEMAFGSLCEQVNNLSAAKWRMLKSHIDSGMSKSQQATSSSKAKKPKQKQRRGGGLDDESNTMENEKRPDLLRIEGPKNSYAPGRQQNGL